MSSNEQMQWVSACETGSNLSALIGAAAKTIQNGLAGRDPDLVLVFVTPHFSACFPHLPALLRSAFPGALVAGCSAGGIIGGGEEIENRPAISITAARLPGVTITPLHTDTEKLPDEDASPDVWRNGLQMGGPPHGHFMVLADPFSARVEPFLNGLDFAFPGATIIGGLASGGQRAGENALVLNEEIYDHGLLCLRFQGNIRIDAIVAQGCRPIGPALTVTRCEQNQLFEVNHQSPLILLNQLFQESSSADQQLMRTSLFIGVAIDTIAEPDANSPFLIRNLIGADYQAGAVAVGALLREGQVVRFFLRDRITSQEDLDAMLFRYATENPLPPCAGALLFSCLGRGQFLYGHPNHDSGRFLGKLGARALGGFFCNGEIGPVGGSTFIHGYTSAFGIFRPPAS